VNGKTTHSHKRDPDLESVTSQSPSGVNMGRGTHLAINVTRSVQTVSIKYHAQEASHPREGINLLIEQINPRPQYCACHQVPISSIGREDVPEKLSIHGRAWK